VVSLFPTSTLPTNSHTSAPSDVTLTQLMGTLPGVIYTQQDMAVVSKRHWNIQFAQVRKLGWQYDWPQTLTYDDFAQLAQLNYPWHYFKAICTLDAYPAIHKAMAELNLTAYLAPFEQEGIADLNEGWDAYWQTRSHNHRRDMARRMNKLTKTGHTVNWITTAEQLDPMLTTFFEWHISYWAAKGVRSSFAAPTEQHMLRAWLNQLVQQQQLWAVSLSIGDELAAISLGARYGNEVFSLLSSYNEAYQAWSPGSSLLYIELEHAAKNGVKQFRLGPGSSYQKSRWQNTLHHSQVVLIPNPKSWVGKAMVAYKLLSRQYKDMTFSEVETT
jgi:CelD/BcsL family acetyltransferase involved in cellulose biosynthesis